VNMMIAKQHVEADEHEKRIAYLATIGVKMRYLGIYLSLLKEGVLKIRSFRVVFEKLQACCTMCANLGKIGR